MRPAKAWMAGVCALSLAGCKGCRNDHPYVPYSIASDAGENEVAETLDAGDDAAEPTIEISATAAPAHTSSWTLSGVTLVAPPATVFELGVVRDFDGDGKPDAVAIARTKAEENDLGALLYYHGESGGLAAPVTVAAAPALGPKGVACTPKRTMSAVGRHSVWLELAAQCPSTLRDPMRQISVWSFRSAQPRQHLSALVLDPPGAPKLSFAVDAADADGDGLDDVKLRVRAEGGDAPFEPLPRAEASIRWFDRPAGMSRDPDAPDGSLRYFASMLAVRAAKAKDAPAVLAQARAVHVLWSALCGGADARVTHFFGGGPLACGTSRALEEAGLAEARANAVLGDPLAAIAALDRAQVPPATKTATRTKDAENWITQIAPIAQATQVRAIAAVPQGSRGTTTPAWGALSFEPSGKLLVRTAAGVVRVDPDQGDENDAGDVASWPASVTSPDGTQRFVEAYDACDGISLHATLMKTDAGDVTDVRLPIAPRLGARCTSAKGAPVATVPLAWTVGGLETIVEGRQLLVLGDRASFLKAAISPVSPHGSARSPDAKTFAIATSLGILVQGETKSRLVRATDLDGTYGEQRDCTVSNDATHVACVRAGKAWVATY